MNNLMAGAASKIINCQVGDAVAGMLEPRQSDRIRDNLEANAFFVTDGKERAVIINCDLVSLQRNFTDEVAGQIEKTVQVPARNVIISCTHTHSGPYTSDGEWGKADREYLRNLKKWLIAAAEKAVKASVPARIGWATGETRIGYNRRVCWADGTHSMYGDTSSPDFTGMEGPDDPSHAVVFAAGEDGKIISIIHNNTCHATTGCAFNYVSADFPGEARSIIRDALGENIPVLYMQGACGDVCRFSQLQPDSPVPEQSGIRDAERRLKEIGCLLAGETLRLVRNTPAREDVVVKHLFAEIKAGIRLPSQNMVEHAKRVIEKGPGKSVTRNIAGGYGFQKGILRLYNEYKDNPYVRVPLHALRIGAFALATVPCECYCQFGLDIKLRSPAEVTAVSELTHGALGYCPTIYGILGGGYSGANYYGCRLEPFAGYMMVEELSRMLHELFSTQMNR